MEILGFIALCAAAGAIMAFREIQALRAEVQQMRIDVDKGLAKTVRQLTDVIETHLEIPDEQTFFRSEEKK